MKELWRGVGWVSASQIYGTLASLVSLSVTARWLGPEGRGIIAAVTTWVTFASSVAGMSLGPVALHLATKRRGEEWLPSVLGSLLSLCACLTLVTWLSVLFLYHVSGGRVFHVQSPLLLIIGFANLPFLIWEQYSSALLGAVERVDVYSQALVVGRTVTLLAILLAWGVGGGIPAVLVGVAAGQAVLALTTLRLLSRAAQRSVRGSPETAAQLMKGALRLHPNFIGGVLATSSGVLVVNHFLGGRETGLYQLAVQLVGLFGILPQAAALVLSGRVATLGPDGAWTSQRRMVPAIMGILLLGGGLAAILSPWGITMIAGERFAPASTVFRILLLSMLGSALATLTLPQWVGRGRFLTISVLSLALGLASLGGNLIVVPMSGIVGAAWVTVGVYAGAALVSAWMCGLCEAQWRQVGSRSAV